MTEAELVERIAELEQKRANVLIALGETQGMLRAYTEMLEQLRTPRREGEVRIGEDVRPNEG